MTIYMGSRYETATVAQITDAAGDQNRVAFRGPSLIPAPLEIQYVLVQAGDRLDRIAYDFYRRADYWWVIADANPGLTLADPLVAGMVLRIPSGRDVS